MANKASVSSKGSVSLRSSGVGSITPKDAMSIATRDGEGAVLLTKCEAVSSGTTLAAKLRRVKKRTTILHPTRMEVPEGSITAILGTAESGKSTLLKFMAGCSDTNLECDGVVNLPGRSSYLPEETELHRFYTPRTYIKHYDRLLSSGDTSSGPGGVSNQMSVEDIERLLDSLRIDYDRRDIIVGDPFHRGLSLGEKRRLELGLLALSCPDTLFCENPVEGLDSATSLHIMEFLKGYCTNSPRRVVITLNRPSQFVWNLIDNVFLLSRGHVVYEGSRVEMEAFFASHNMATPARFSQLEHYLAVVNNFRRPAVSTDWEVSFRKWQRDRREKSDKGSVVNDVETGITLTIPNVVIPQMENHDKGNDKKCISKLACCSCDKYPELVKRYFLQMLFNPGILQIRLVMYTGLSLFLGALYWQFQMNFEEAESIAALLFYSSSFYIFMVCATIPFLAQDLQIRNKEVLNGFYHPITHHFAVVLCTIPACLILAFIISVILVNMVGLRNGLEFFLIMALALWCGDAMAILISLWAPHFIVGIVVCAGICGCFMALEGFMIVPSKFPLWLRWTYPVPFHTYVFRSLMFIEFQYGGPDDTGHHLGHEVLMTYEITEDTGGHDEVVLLCYGLIIHLVSALTILLGRRRYLRKQPKKVLEAVEEEQA